MPAINTALAEIVTGHLLQYLPHAAFPAVPLDGLAWWWPMTNGRTAAHWGPAVPPHHGPSLWGAPAPPAGCATLQHFPGSVCACVGATVLITTRPSTGTFPMKRAAECARVMNQLRRVFTDDELDTRVHITDVIKFRGRYADKGGLKGLTAAKWESTFACLCDEIELLVPQSILVSLTAAVWIQEAVEGRGFEVVGGGRWAPGQNLRDRLEAIRYHLNFRAIPGLYDQVNANGKAMAWMTALGRHGGPLLIRR